MFESSSYTGYVAHSCWPGKKFKSIGQLRISMNKLDLHACIFQLFIRKWDKSKNYLYIWHMEINLTYPWCHIFEWCNMYYYPFWDEFWNLKLLAFVEYGNILTYPITHSEMNLKSQVVCLCWI
jgi:hypothetical protein